MHDGDTDPNEPLDPFGLGKWDEQRIGPFKILQTLGQGGMGVVYEAAQTSPVKRRVALKVIHTGLNTDEIVARFEAERQALAVMDHPNIAKVFEAGLTTDGRPYFAMELVQGVRIDEYCDTLRLDAKERLRLFVQVCRAVQHAHQKGVIHRDLKPANILVATNDNESIPKVIDFGIAKAVGLELTERTLVTEIGQALGTPEYMSPEQAEMSGLDIDTRTDIYSLGVILYELLVGARPIDLGGVSWAAVSAAIRQRNPPAPSTRLSTLPGETQETIAEDRQTDPGGLKRVVRGDLDWVTLKCLAKDRTRRYETASELARDVERFLQFEPVEARRPSWSHRAGRFVRRHRGGVAAAGLILAGIVGSVFGLVRSGQLGARADFEAEMSGEITAFFFGLLTGPIDSLGTGSQFTTRQLLERAIERARVDLAEDPELQAAMYYVLAMTSVLHGDFGNAIDLYEHVLGTRYLDEALEERADVLSELGGLYADRGRFEEAERHFREVRALYTEEHGPTSSETIDASQELGSFLVDTGRHSEGLSVLEEASADAESNLAPRDPVRLLAPLVLSGAYRTAGRHDQALDVGQEALGELQGLERVMGLGFVGRLEFDRGRYEAARELLSEGLKLREGLSLPPIVSGPVVYTLAALHAEVGEFEEAERLLTPLLASWEILYPETRRLGLALGILARVRNGQGRIDDALRLGERAVAIREAAPAGFAGDWAVVLHALADSYAALDRAADAERRYAEALELAERGWGRDHWRIEGVLESYAGFLRSTDRGSEAEPLERRAAAIRAGSTPGG